MRKRTITAACIAGALSALLWTEEAKAEGFSWGHATLNGGPRFASENLDFGLGLNVGYTLDMGLYLGGLADWYFDGRGADVSFFMFDIGYDIGFGDKFVLRPSGSVGIGTVWFDRCGPIGGCDNDSRTDFGMTGGANAIYAISQLTIGGEVRFFWVNDFDDVGIWGGFNIGVVF
jgi:hypothetical protein